MKEQVMYGSGCSDRLPKLAAVFDQWPLYANKRSLSDRAGPTWHLCPLLHSQRGHIIGSVVQVWCDENCEGLWVTKSDVNMWEKRDWFKPKVPSSYWTTMMILLWHSGVFLWPLLSNLQLVCATWRRCRAHVTISVFSWIQMFDLCPPPPAYFFFLFPC